MFNYYTAHSYLFHLREIITTVDLKMASNTFLFFSLSAFLLLKSWVIVLGQFLLYLVAILYLFKISIFYMKINLTTAIHCDVLFHGDPASLRL